MAELSHWWHFEFLGNELGQWAIALAIFLVTFTVLPIAKRAISRQRRREYPASQAYAALDLLAALVEHTSRLFLWGVALWLASRDWPSRRRSTARSTSCWCCSCGCRWRCGP